MFTIPKSVSILGTKYTVEVKKVADDLKLSQPGVNAYVNVFSKRIIIGDLSDEKAYPFTAIDPETQKGRYKHTLRHEITHAFMRECGLGESAEFPSNSTITNEMLVDWIAIQVPKLYNIWKRYDLI